MICKSLLSKREYHQIRIPCDLHGEKERFESMNFAIIGCGVIAFTHAKALEALRGDRAGQHSIRVNDQWRICFRWTDAGAEDVEIVDYH